MNDHTVTRTYKAVKKKKKTTSFHDSEWSNVAAVLNVVKESQEKILVAAEYTV